MKLIVTITFAVFTLANSACVKKDGGPVQCCDQRGHGGPLLCCAGQNNSCIMSTAAFVNRSRCYCDEHCKVASDCCPDFEKSCGFIDTNECRQQDKGGCSHGCVNTLGSYHCTCPNGFQLNNGRTCQDINECRQRDKGGCSHGCVNTLGSYRCTCPNCFQLNNGKTCRDIRTRGHRRQVVNGIVITEFKSCLESHQEDMFKYVKEGNCYASSDLWDIRCKMLLKLSECFYYATCIRIPDRYDWNCTNVHRGSANPFCCDPICQVKPTTQATTLPKQ